MPDIILDLKDTKIGEAIREEGITITSAERIARFLTEQGFPPDATRGVRLYPDGKVLVVTDLDPSGVWQDFSNEPLAASAAIEEKLAKLRKFRDDAKAGNFTMTDQKDILIIIVEAMLKAYGEE